MKNSCYEDYNDLRRKLGIEDLCLRGISVYGLQFNTLTYNLYSMGCVIPDCENLIIKDIGNVYKSYSEDELRFADIAISIGARKYIYCNCTSRDIYIGRSASVGHSVQRVDLYGRIRGIVDYAFYKNLKLSKVIFPAGLKEICNNAFYSCSRLEDINLDICRELEYIGDSAFIGCYIRALDLSKTMLKSIGEDAFSSNQPLKKAILPKTLTNLSIGCFRNCVSLEYINIPGSVKEIKKETLTAGSPNGTEIQIEEGVEAIRRNAFMFLNIKDITIPKSVKQFARECFYHCNIKRIRLPKEIFEFLKSKDWCRTRSGLESYIVGCDNECHVELY